VLLHGSSVKRVPGKAYNRGKESKQGAWKAEADDVAETLDMGTKFVVFNNFYDSLATVGSDCVLCCELGRNSKSKKGFIVYLVREFIGSLLRNV
jgi:hypothetical protein